MNFSKQILIGLVMVLMCLVILLPMGSIVYIALFGGGDLQEYIQNGAFRRYIVNTIYLVILVSVLASIFGVASACLVTIYNFPFRRILEYSLFFPLAIPAYVGAYALVDFFEYAGPVQGLLREIFGWKDASDYYFPEIRSLGGASITLSLVLFPYVYLFTRVALREQSSAIIDIASTLGKGPFIRLFRVIIPLVRPGIFAGLIIVMMETIADFGVVEYFAVQTVTTGIYTVWLEAYDLSAAAMLSVIVLVFILIIILGERALRFNSEFHKVLHAPIFSKRNDLPRFASWLATGFCSLLVGLGFILPVTIMITHAFSSWELWFEKELIDAFVNSLYTSGIAAFLTLAIAIILVYGQTITKYRFSRFLMPTLTLGYAIPGAVIGIGILISLASFDHILADWISMKFGYDPGLLLTGTAFAVIFAYFIRFYAIAQNIVEAALGRVPPSLIMVPRSLGKSAQESLVSVHLPIIRGSLVTGLILVFVDCIKELPATLLLRPFDFNTLATRVYDRASLENLSQAAPAALLIVLIGCCGVFLLINTDRTGNSV